jgi:CO/xanthine dehydrogenase Mo-binding subunit
MQIVGAPHARVDALAKVTGQARYAGDLSLPGMLHLKLVLCDRPHARLLSLDPSRTLAQPGVVAVLSGADVPYNFTGVERADKPVLCDQVVRCVGDAVALVVAETPEQAAAAALLVGVEYQDLPVVAGPRQALRAEAPQLHPGYPGNLAHRVQVRKGDLAAAWALCAAVYEQEYDTPMQEHAFLEPEAGLGFIDDEGRVTVITAGQDPHEDRRQLARMLRLPEEQVRVVYGPIGGAFGGREDVTIQPFLALAAWKLRRPVKMVWDRAESIRCHPKRHAMLLRYKWGADRDGRLLAAQCDITSDAGAYLSTSASVLDNYRFAAIGPYDIPNVVVDARAVYTNNLTAGAFRGFGTPQATFAAELQVDHLAELLGIDPVSMRLRNGLREGCTLSTGSLLSGGSSLPPLVEACVRQAGGEVQGNGWVLPKATTMQGKRYGVGIAAGMKNTAFSFGFPEGAGARLVLHGGTQIERAELFIAAADVGQGAHTVLAQMAAQELGLPLEKITLHASDTAASLPGGPASASRLTFVAGNAVRQAALQALRAWRDENRPATGEARWDAPHTFPPDPLTGATSYHSLSFTFAAQAVRVEVDLDTGIVRLCEVTTAIDPGKAVNPLAAQGQVEGALVQAQGWALLEDFVTQDGFVLTDQLSTYLIPTVLDVPEQVTSLFLEKADPLGPYGARGLGEIPFVPLAPAILSAIHDALGVWFDHIPLRPQEIVAACQAAGG